MKKDIDYNQLSIAIPTNSRPTSLRNCILSVLKNIHHSCQILVLDSTPLESDSKIFQDYEEIYKEFSSIKLLKYNHNIPPGKARKILSENIKTELALFLDDDLEISKNAFGKMFNALIEEDYDIMSGLWLEDESKRPLGFLFTNATHDNEKIVLKSEVGLEQIPSDSVVQLHDVQASLLVRMSIFSQVNFDERFDFFFELYDFFYQCRLKGLKVGAHTGALFYHKPTPYLSKSSRYYQNREADSNRFLEKWGLLPKFARHPTTKKDYLNRKVSLKSFLYKIFRVRV